MTRCCGMELNMPLTAGGTSAASFEADRMAAPQAAWAPFSCAASSACAGCGGHRAGRGYRLGDESRPVRLRGAGSWQFVGTGQKKAVSHVQLTA